ncbi:MAG: hypothetical protein IJI77_01525 [Erysipelotrichaceae bacterium]|nr:hypothetical protein [Erysipelotrichaceae bacterium]
MKCIYCAKKPNMIKKTDGKHNWWWECPVCHRTVGKKEEEEEKKDD